MLDCILYYNIFTVDKEHNINCSKGYTDIGGTDAAPESLNLMPDRKELLIVLGIYFGVKVYLTHGIPKGSTVFYNRLRRLQDAKPRQTVFF